jgi:hypothetical protein
MNIVKRMFSRTKHSSLALTAMATILAVSTTAFALDPPSITIDSTEPGSPITIYTEDAVLPDSINVGVNVTSTYGEDPNIGPAENPVNIQQVLLGVDEALTPVTPASTGDDLEDQIKSWFGIVDLTNAADAASPSFSTTIEAYAAINLYYDPSTTEDGQQADTDSIAITVNIEDLFDIDSTDDGDPMPDEATWGAPITGGETLSAIGLSGNPVVTKIGLLGSTECYSLLVDGELLEVCIDASNTSLAALKIALTGTTEVDNAIDGFFVLTLATESRDLNTDGYTLLDEDTPAPNQSDIFARVLLILKQKDSNIWTALSIDLPQAVALGYTVGGPGVIDPNIMRVFTTDVTRTTGVNSTYTITDANNPYIYELGDSDGVGIDAPILSPTDDHFYEGIIRDVNSILGFQIALGVDTTSPVIFIIGNNPTFILVDEEYIDLGATVYDEVDGTSAADVLSNNVNTAIAGNYTVVYTAPDDAAGNPVTPKTRNVYVRTVLTPPPPQGGGGGGGGCFIATAAYGTPMAQEINTLREVRDTYLLSNSLGTAFVDAYYRISPSIADDVAAHPALATLVRAVLTPIIWVTQVLLSHSTWLLALTALSLLMTVRIVRKKLQQSTTL